MHINDDSVPSTIEAAVDQLVASLTDQDREQIRQSDSIGLHHSSGRFLRNNWSLWEPSTPIKLDAVSKYGINHADDLSGLILAWLFAKVRGDESFDPVEHCKQYHEHWRSMGIDPAKAGDSV
jgi:hypothetical protein